MLGSFFDELLDETEEIYEDVGSTAVDAASTVIAAISPPAKEHPSRTTRGLRIAAFTLTGLLIAFCAYKFLPGMFSILPVWVSIFPIVMAIEFIFRGKKSIVLKIFKAIFKVLKWIGLPSLVFVGSFFSRDSFVVKFVRGFLQGIVTFLHGLLSDRRGYNRGYEDAMQGKSKRWWRR